MVLSTMATPGPVGTPVPLSTFGVPAANNINEIITELTPILSAWTTYTPTWLSTGTAPAIGTGTLSGRYVRLGKWGMVTIVMTLDGSSTPGTGFYSWGLPPGWTAATNPAGTVVVGLARVSDTPTSYLGAVNVASGGTTVNVGIHGANVGVQAVNTAPSPVFTFGTGDGVFMEIKMELA